MKNYSDLINELSIEFSVFKGVKTVETAEHKFGYELDFYSVKTAKQASKLGKECGNYAVLSFPQFLDNNKSALQYYYRQFKAVLSEFLGDVKQSDVILVVGLGNRHISADSLGVEVVKRLIVTREMASKLPSVCAFSPSVLGLTGIETADTVEAIVDKVRPTMIIYIDSLCASHSARLGRSFQISSTAITPGAGVYNTRRKPKTLVCKTISIGVPFVVYAGTFLKSELEDENISINDIKDNKLKTAINRILSTRNDQLVTLKDIEESVAKAGKFVAHAINEIIFGVKEL